eukprot:XP_004913223.1 PREDICTED: protein spinster homolog 1-like [Xenopus tropicalis]
MSCSVLKKRDIERNIENEEKTDMMSVEKNAPPQISFRRALFTVFLYIYLSFVDFMDQFIFIVFICTRAILAPFFGCASDRYNRKKVICIGLFFYSLFAFGCTYIPKQGFWIFMLARLAVSAMAESCLTPVPSLIADLFGPEKRTRILALYMCTKAVFCIIASCFGTPVINLAGLNWRNALRITPGFGLFGLLLAIIVMKEPQRGGMEDDKNGDEGTKLNCSCYTNLKQLLKSCHFLTFTAGILCYAYVLGAKYFWVPGIIRQARKDVPIEVYCWTTDCSYDDNLIFGIIKCASDLIGIIIGTEISKRCQKKNPNVDALLCGIGLFFCAPFFVLFIFFVEINLPAAYNLVSPELRGTASSIQILFAKLIGKVGSIYFIMLISEAILKHNYTRLSSVQFALTLAPLVAMIGGIVFFTVYLLKQKRAAKPGPEAVISQK